MTVCEEIYVSEIETLMFLFIRNANPVEKKRTIAKTCTRSRRWANISTNYRHVTFFNILLQDLFYRLFELLLTKILSLLIIYLIYSGRKI